MARESDGIGRVGAFAVAVGIGAAVGLAPPGLASATPTDDQPSSADGDNNAEARSPESRVAHRSPVRDQGERPVRPPLRARGHTAPSLAGEQDAGALDTALPPKDATPQAQDPMPEGSKYSDRFPALSVPAKSSAISPPRTKRSDIEVPEAVAVPTDIARETAQINNAAGTESDGQVVAAQGAVAPAAAVSMSIPAMVSTPVRAAVQSEAPLPLLDSVLSPFYGSDPNAPVESPTSWVMLAAARREVGKQAPAWTAPAAAVVTSGLTVASPQPQALSAAATPQQAAATADDGETEPSLNEIIEYTLFHKSATAGPSQNLGQSPRGVITGNINAKTANGSKMVYTIAQAPANGIVSLGQDGSYTYTPDADFAYTGGTDAFGVTIDNGIRYRLTGIGGAIQGFYSTLAQLLGLRQPDTVTVAVSVSITPTNAAPVAGIPVVGTPDGVTGVVAGTVSATDADKDTVTFSAPAGTAKGSVSINAGTGAFTYTPTPTARHDAARIGALPEDKIDTFTVTATDGRGGSNGIPVTVTISPTNATPVSSSTSSSTMISTPDRATGKVVGKVAASDADNDSLTYSGPTTAARGYVAVNADGSFTYTPAERVRTYEVTGAFAGISRPLDIAFNPNGTRAFIVDSGGLSVIDTSTNALVSRTNIPSASGIAVSPDGARAYVTSCDNGTMSVFDTATNKALGTVVGVDTPTKLSISDDGRKAYILGASGTLSVIDTAAGAVITTIRGVSSGLVALSPDGKSAYVAKPGTQTVEVLDIPSGTVSTTYTGFGEPSAIELSPDGSQLWVGTGSNKLMVLDTTTSKFKQADAFFPDSIYDIALSPDGARAYVSHSSFGWEREVAVIDTATTAVVTTITGFSGARQITVDPTGKRISVSNTDGTIAFADVDAKPTDTFIITATDGHGGSVDIPVSVRFIPVGGAETSLPSLIAHRGLGSQFTAFVNGPLGGIEGTLYSISAAFAAGAPSVRIHVRQLADGTLVVMHDQTVDRTTNGTGPVNSYNLATFKALVVDTDRPGFGVAMPEVLHPATLDEVLDQWGGRRHLQIDASDGYAVQDIIEVLEERGLTQGEVTVSVWGTQAAQQVVDAGLEPLFFAPAYPNKGSDSSSLAGLKFWGSGEPKYVGLINPSVAYRTLQLQRGSTAVVAPNGGLTSVDGWNITGNGIAPGSTLTVISDSTGTLSIPATAARTSETAIWASDAIRSAYLKSLIDAGLTPVGMTTPLRSEKDFLFSNGVEHVFTNEPLYLAATQQIRPATVPDPTSRGQWAHGRLSNPMFGRGILANGGQTLNGNYGSLPGWHIVGDASYLAEVPPAYMIKSDVSFVTMPTDKTRWLGVMFGLASDAQVTTVSTKYADNGSGAIELRNGYHLVMRANGQVQIWRSDESGQTNVLIGATQNMTTPPKPGETYKAVIAVTGETITASVKNADETVTYATVTARDSTYRGGYVAIGKSQANPNDVFSPVFKNISVGDSALWERIDAGYPDKPGGRTFLT